MTKIKSEFIEKFYKDESVKILMEINKMVCNEDMAEEIYHEGILRCIEDMCKWNGKEVITAEAVMSACKSAAAKKAQTEKSLNRTMRVYPDPFELVTAEEGVRDILKEIDKLRTYSSVLKLYLFENFSVKEISALLNVKPDTVSKQILRGKEKLSARLKRSKALQSRFL